MNELRRYGSSGRCPICRQAHSDLTPVQVLVDRAADSTDSTVEPEQAPGLYGEIAKRVESGHGEPPEYAWTDPDLGLWSFGSHGYPCELGATVSTDECDACHH